MEKRTLAARWKGWVAGVEAFWWSVLPAVAGHGRAEGLRPPARQKDGRAGRKAERGKLAAWRKGRKTGAEAFWGFALPAGGPQLRRRTGGRDRGWIRKDAQRRG